MVIVEAKKKKGADARCKHHVTGTRNIYQYTVQLMSVAALKDILKR